MSRSSVFSFALALPGAFALSLPTLADSGSRSVDAENQDDHHFDHDDFTVNFGFDLFSWDDDDGESQLKVLDLMLFSLVDKRSREPDYSHLEVFDAPLVTGFESRHDGEDHLTQVLDLPLFTLFRSERHARESDLRVIDLPIIGSLFRHRVTPHKERTEVLFLFRFVRPIVATDPPPVD